MSENLSKLSGRKGGIRHNLFEKMVEAARVSGSPGSRMLSKLADDYAMGDAITYGASTFYDFMKPENQGKKVYTCNGSVCLNAGTQETLKSRLSEFFNADEIGEMCCLGRCHENSAFYYQGKNYSAKSLDEMKMIIHDDMTEHHIDHYHVQAMGEAILTAKHTMDEVFTSIGDVLSKPAEAVLAEVKTSGVRGRGGAGFPMGLKLESCKSTESDEKFIVCNADEGDPGAFTDRYLLEHQPYLVLYGMIISGYIVGAQWGVLYIRAEYPESVDVINEAIQQLYDNGYLGEDIQGSGFNYDMKVIVAAGAYICGEETALLNSIEGQRPEVRVRPPYPTQEGLFGKPTVVNNVETFASMHFIQTQGGAAYAQRGTEKSTGTKLVSLDSFFNRPGVYEVDMGTDLEEILNELGEGFASPVKALHIGGPLGGIVPISEVENLTLDFESFQQGGFLLGHASIVCIPESKPMAEYLKHLFEFTAHESCGKCFPCRLGATRGAELFEKAIDSDYKIDRKLLDDLLETMEAGSLCALGGGLPLGVKNALMYFEAELRETIEG